MNILYSLLTYSAPAGSSEYTKKTSSVQHTTRSRKICNELLKKVPSSRIKIFACYLCWLVCKSQFRNSILELDPVNTYCEPLAHDDTYEVDSTLCMYDMTSSRDDMRVLTLMLDQDIQAVLEPATWLDTASAACLQMLREVVKK